MTKTKKWEVIRREVDTGKIRTIETTIGLTIVAITRSIHCQPDVWKMYWYGIAEKELENKKLKLAKKEALELIRKRLKKMLIDIESRM